ncbi:MAG: hypothetical protein AAB439_00395 [Patescibacteria group bacterium]
MSEQKEGAKGAWALRFEAVGRYVLLAGALVLLLTGFLGCFNFDATSCLGGAGIRMLQVSALAVGVAGAMLDWSLVRYLLNMGEFLGQGGGFGNAIAAAWTIFRNLINLVFIAGLVWAAISLILGNDAGGQKPGKLVIQLIIAALLVNFSYFFAAVIIDASNFTTRAIYQEAFYGEVGVNFARGTEAGRERDINKDVTSYLKNEKISDRFLVATKLGSVSAIENLREGDRELGFSILLIGIVGSVLFLVTAMIFFQFVTVMVGRFIVIIILLITSPVGILRLTGLPVVSNWGKAWWDALISQAVFPPVFVILVASSLAIIEGGAAQLLKGTNGTIVDFLLNNAKGFNSTDPTYVAGQFARFYGAFDLILLYVIAAGLLFASLKIAINIAEQAPVAIPTTKDIYQFRKDLYKRAGALGKGAADLIAAPGKLPLSYNLLGGLIRFKIGPQYDKEGRPYRDLGDYIAQGPSQRAVPSDPDSMTPEQRAAHRQADFAYEEYSKAFNRLMEKIASGASEEEIVAARQETAELFARIPDESYKTAERNKKRKSPKEQEEFDRVDLESRTVPSRARATLKAAEKEAAQEKPAPAGGGGQKSQPLPGKPAAPATPTHSLSPDAVAISNSVDQFNLEERRRDRKGDEELEKLRVAFVDALKTYGPKVTVTDMGGLARNTNITPQQFDLIRDEVPQTVRDAFNASPASVTRPSKPKQQGGGDTNPVI